MRGGDYSDRRYARLGKSGIALAHRGTEGVGSTEGKSRTGAIPFRFLAQPVAGNAGVLIGKPEIGELTHDGETRRIRADRHQR